MSSHHRAGPDSQGSRAALPDAIARHVSSARALMRRQREHMSERMASVSVLDRVLGGLGRGDTLEVVGRGSSGRSSLLLALLASVTGRGEPAALVDRTSSFDPGVAQRAGVDLPHLLWARTQTMRETLASAEIVLGAGMPLVVLDLGMPPLTGGRGAEAAWLRLARAARKARTALVIAAPYRVSGTAATAIVEMRARGGRWRASGGWQPALLDGLDSRLLLAKSRQPVPAMAGTPGAGHGIARWTVAEAIVIADTVIEHAARSAAADTDESAVHAVA